LYPDLNPGLKPRGFDPPGFAPPNFGFPYAGFADFEKPPLEGLDFQSPLPLEGLDRSAVLPPCFPGLSRKKGRFSASRGLPAP
jgi:hypothetical protein